MTAKNRKRIFLFGILLAFIGLPGGLLADDIAPRAVQGVIDLRGHDFREGGAVSLDGEWGFHWGRVLNESNFMEILESQPNLYTVVPSYWNKLKEVDSEIGPRGAATYSLRMLVDNTDELLALKFLNITPNAKVAVNGIVEKESGRVSADEELSVSGNSIHVLPVGVDSGEILLAVSISNFHNVKGGLNRPVQFGFYDDLRRRREIYLGLDGIFLGGLLLMGLYQLALYFMSPRRRAPVYLAALCLLAFLFSGMKNEMALLAVFPGWDGEIRTKFIYLGLALATPLFNLYALSLYPDYFKRGFIKVAAPVAGIAVVIILVTSKAFYTQLLIPLEILLLFGGFHNIAMLIIGYIRNKDSRLILYLTGLGFLLLSIVFGMVDNEYNFVFRSPAAVFFVFVLYQAFLQAEIFSNAFQQIDHLSDQKSTLEKRNIELFSMSYIDSLTGVCNRRLMDDFLASTWRVAALSERSLGMILIDVDDFRAYNDFYGHRQGDQCLVRVSELIRGALDNPGSHTLARYGGKEFAVIISDSDDMGLYHIAEKLREAVEAGRIMHQGSTTGSVVTVSLGCACFIPSPDEAPESLIDAADKALDQAISKGRNRTELYGEAAQYGSWGPKLV